MNNFRQRAIFVRLKQPFLWLFIIVTFGLLYNMPAPILYTTLNTLWLFILVFFLIYYSLSAFRKKQFSKIYLILMALLIVPVYGALNAKVIFNQPILYGLLAERPKVFAVGGFLIVVLLEKNWFSLKELERAILNVGTVFFSLVLFTALFVPKAILSNYDFAVETISKGFRLNINHGLIVVLYFLSLVKSIFDFKLKHAVLALLIFLYIAFIYKARTLTLSVSFVTLLFFLQYLKANSLIKVFSILGSACVIGALLGFFFFSEELFKISELFISAFNVVLGGEVIDPSSQSRISEFEIARNGFFNHPILGNGFLSSRFNGGFSGIYGHFYPSDIGWFGMLFLYGVVGLIIYFIPFINTWFYSHRISAKKSPFILALRYVMFYFIIQGIVAGFLVKKLGMIFFVFALIYYHYYHSKQIDRSI